MRVVAVTKKGPNKVDNEDRVVVGNSIIADGTLLSEMEEGIAAIADGVGGNNAGSVASHFVASRLCVMPEISVEQLRAVNEELLQVAEANGELRGMATTLAGINCLGEKMQLFSIGNTRVYLLQSGKYLKQLTTDDTTVNYLVFTGRLTSEEVNSFDRKNEITACFGGNSSNLFKMKLSIFDTPPAPIMITSDGIHDYLSVDQMEDIIEEGDLGEGTCEKLIRSARDNGSIDDASVVLVGC